MNPNVYRWCAVPQCHNTTIKTPNKLFINVPMQKKVRNAWLNLARRDPAAVSNNSVICFCEDHFDLPNDMENYMEYHVMGSVSKVRMKPGCMPHKLLCQPDQPERPYKAKKRRMMISEGCIKEFEEKSIVTEQSSSEEIASGSLVQQNVEEMPQLTPRVLNKSVQPNLNFEASNVAACRICLATDVKMYRLRDTHLGRCMESITGFNKSHEELPNFVCYECAACLMKCSKLIERSRTAQATLLDIFHKNGQVTKTLIEEENRSELNLQSSLDKSDPINIDIESSNDLNTSDCSRFVAETDLDEPLEHTMENEIKEELPDEDIDISEDLNALDTLSDVTITNGISQMKQTEGKAEKGRIKTNKMAKTMDIFTFEETPKEKYKQKYIYVDVQKTNTKKYICNFCLKSFILCSRDDATNHILAGCSVSRGGNTSSIASSTTLKNVQRINTVMTEELPLGSPLKTPHAKRPKTLDYQGVDDYHSESEITAAPLVIKLEPYDQPPTSTSHVLTVTSSAAHVDRNTTTPTATRIAQPCRDPLGNDEICNIQDYGDFTKCTFSRMRFFEVWATLHGSMLERYQHILLAFQVTISNKKLDLSPLEIRVFILCKRMADLWKSVNRTKTTLLNKYADWLNVIECVELKISNEDCTTTEHK